MANYQKYCVDKSFSDFWAFLIALGLQVSEIQNTPICKSNISKENL